MEGGTPNNKLTKRSAVICGVIITLLLLLCIKVFCIQVFDFDEYEQKVLDQITQTTPVSANRGEIYDTNGIVLATNITTYRLFIDPSVISKQSREDDVDYASLIAGGLSEIAELDITYDEIMKQMQYTGYRDRTLQKHISEEAADKVRLFLEEKNLDSLALVHLQATSKRYYPYENLASHVLGFTNSDGTGIYGLEYQYNEELSGTDGKYITAKDSSGNKMPYNYESYVPAIDGYSIVTTIDVYIQAELEEQVKQAYLDSAGENRACGIVMDVNTGAVLAMATYPNFDLNDPWTLNDYAMAELEASGYSEGSEEYSSLKQQLMFEMWNNKAVTEVYMPGSTFKCITAAMAYEENLVTDRLYSCPGYGTVAGETIHCHKLTGHGQLTFARGLQQSCNPVLMAMGAAIGSDRFYNYFDTFGYLDKTGIDLPGEGTSIFFSEEEIHNELNLAVSSFGQNFKISVMQHISAINAVANGGYLVTPHLIKEIRDNDGNVIYTYENNVKRQVISEETSRQVSAVLNEGVETDGGAKNAYVAGYRVAAKTGTSEKKDIESTEGKKYVCSTIAYAPAEAPEISVLLLVDEPTTSTNGLIYASTIAAPYVGKVLEEVLPYYGVEAKFDDDELEKQSIQTPWLLTLGVERAKGLADAYGVKLEIVGDGNTVVGQSPDPMTLMERGNATVIIYTTEEAKNNPEQVMVPNLIDKNALEASKTLLSYGLNVKIYGTNSYLSGTSATVYEQSVAPGVMVDKGTVIEIHFKEDDEDYNPDVVR